MSRRLPPSPANGAEQALDSALPLQPIPEDAHPAADDAAPKARPLTAIELLRADRAAAAPPPSPLERLRAASETAPTATPEGLNIRPDDVIKTWHQAPGDSQYVVVNGRIAILRELKKDDGDGDISFTFLTNFGAQIVEDQLFDDGSGEIRRVYRIAGKLADGTALPEARVDAAQFSDLKWIDPSWGARARVYVGRDFAKHTQDAIRFLSTAKTRTIYGHAGWRKDNGRDIYLYNGGAVGAEGVSVEIGGALARFSLPGPDPAIPLVEAIRASLAIREIAPPEIIIPLLGATYLAPVASLIAPDLAVWLVGTTGSFKTELAALAQAHYGAFDRGHLPADWSATDNALEMRLFLLKDAICVIDDYAPQSDPRAQREIEKKAQRILRAAGNLSARGRLRADLSQRPDRPPRGVLVATGEDMPPGESILGRLVPVECNRSAINLPALTRSQDRRALLPHAMRGYIEQLRSEYEQLPPALRAKHGEYATALRGIGAHPRTPVALAFLRLGIELLANYALDAGAIDAHGAAALRDEADVALRAIGTRSARPLVESSLAEKCMSALRSMLATGQVQLAPKTMVATVPDSIGWRGDEFFFIDSGELHRRVATYYRESGQTFTTSKPMLYKALESAGYIVPRVESGEKRYDVKERCGGAVRRVLRFRVAAFDTLADAGAPPTVAP